MDYDEVANLSNLTFDQEVTPEQSMQLLTQEIIFTILVAIGIVADFAIIYTTFRFRRLQTVPNIFLANWAIADFCSLVVTPSSYRLISILDEESLSQEFMCVLFQTDLIFHHTAMMFMIVVSVDWCIAALFPKASRRFRSCSKYLIAGVWLFALLISSLLMRLCIRRVFCQAPIFMLVFDYCTMVLLIVALHACRGARKFTQKALNYPTLMLTLATVYAMCWFMGFMNFLFLELEGAHSAVRLIIECFIFCSSIINFLFLYRYNRDFQACFQQILKRPDERYVDNLSELENSDRNASDKSNVRISLEKANEQPPTSA